MLEPEKIYENIDEAIEELRGRRKTLLEERNRIIDEMDAILDTIHAMERIKNDINVINEFGKKYCKEENKG